MGSQFEDAGAMNPSDCSFLFFLSKILYLFLIMNIMSMGGAWYAQECISARGQKRTSNPVELQVIVKQL